MSSTSRIKSVLNTITLDLSKEDFTPFDLSSLEVEQLPNIEIPSKLRLGHIIEKVVSGLIRSSNNFELLYENIQIIEEKTTIGEIDYILKEKNTQQQIHLELAYKFYLYDPTVSSNLLENWIGPNRKDALVEKLEKLKSRQFPLLYKTSAQAELPKVDFEHIQQKLCLMANLFVPHNYHDNFTSSFKKAIQGVYYDQNTFFNQNHQGKLFYIPPKKDWGIPPKENKEWLTLSDFEQQLKEILTRKQAPLCWQKQGNQYTQFFVVWW